MEKAGEESTEGGDIRKQLTSEGLPEQYESSTKLQ